MNKKFLIIGLLLISVGLILTTSSVAHAQNQNEFTVPLSDPAKRGKFKVHLNYGSITVKGTARKDVLVKYISADDDDDDNGDASRAGLKRIAGGGVNLEVTESNNQ